MLLFSVKEEGQPRICVGLYSEEKGEESHISEITEMLLLLVNG